MKSPKLKKSFISEMRRRYTNRYLAKILGYSESTVCLYMTEKRAPSKDFIFNVYHKFNKPIEEIVK